MQIQSVAYQDFFAVPIEQPDTIKNQNSVFSIEDAMAARALNEPGKPETAAKVSTAGDFSRTGTGKRKDAASTPADTQTPSGENSADNEQTDELSDLTTLIAAGVTVGAFLKTDQTPSQTFQSFTAPAGDAIPTPLPVGVSTELSAAQPSFPPPETALTEAGILAAPQTEAAKLINADTAQPSNTDAVQPINTDAAQQINTDAAARLLKAEAPATAQQPADMGKKAAIITTIPIRQTAADSSAADKNMTAQNIAVPEQLAVASIEVTKEATPPTADKTVAAEKITAAIPPPPQPPADHVQGSEKMTVPAEIPVKPVADLHAQTKDQPVAAPQQTQPAPEQKSQPDEPVIQLVKNGAPLPAMDSMFSKILGRQPGGLTGTDGNAITVRDNNAPSSRPLSAEGVIQVGKIDENNTNLFADNNKEKPTGPAIVSTEFIPADQAVHTTAGQQHAPAEVFTPDIPETTPLSPAQAIQATRPLADQADTAVRLPPGIPVAESQVVERVVERLSFSVNGRLETSTVSIRMHPAELGQLRVELEVSKEGVKAVLIAQTQQAQDILERHMPKLREGLEMQGLRLDDVQVRLDLGNEKRDLYQGSNQEMLSSDSRQQGREERKARNVPPVEIIQGISQQQAASSGINLRI